MAAIDAPWLGSGAGTPMALPDDPFASSATTFEPQAPSSSGVPPTYAAFSPVTLSANTPSRSARQSTILVHQKSPLLLATPPQITRALAYSHPFLLPLNYFLGLLTWSTGDPWQSFLLLCTFWGTVLYGDVLVRWTGPVNAGAVLILCMYARRYSPLSSSGWKESGRDGKTSTQSTSNSKTSANAAATSEAKSAKHARAPSEITNTKHQKTLDEIVENLKEFTGRCNALLEPMLELTDFLSTQRTPTSATTKPALTAMFMRLLVVTPFWFALTLPPWQIITVRRVVLVVGSITLTWHARVMRVTRALLWRSAWVRRVAGTVTGLEFDTAAPHLHQKRGGQQLDSKAGESELSKAFSKSSASQLRHRHRGGESAGVKFTFIIYENQRRWVGLGWTNSLFAYERPAWTDEHNNGIAPKDEFELPEVEDGSRMKWRWAEGSRWRVDGVADENSAVNYDSDEAKNGWLYYDNKWQNGRRGLDGWGRWTRRRKWYRDAELVEDDDPRPNTEQATQASTNATSADKEKSDVADDAASVLSTSTGSRSFFRFPAMNKKSAPAPASITTETTNSNNKTKLRRASSSILDDDMSGLNIELEMELEKQGKVSEQWGIGDEARMSLE